METQQIKKHFAIHVASWGTLFCIGTDEQAEEWRRHKARWEQSVARTRLASDEEIKNEKFKELSDLLPDRTKRV